MNRALIDNVARAVLYEGYVLYPYRPSVKTRQRWTFGGVYPRAWNQSQNSSDACSMQTECLVEANESAKLSVGVRFLHLIDRTVLDANAQPVQVLEVGGKSYRPWQEAGERSIDFGDLFLRDLLAGANKTEFAFPEHRAVEPLDHAGALVRQQQAIAGKVEVSAAAIEDGLFRITVTISNETPISGRAVGRDDALLRSLVSTHTILGIENGAWVSLIDPPQKWQTHARECKNIGAWPVLVGDEPERDAMLSSPIILYDYPQIAPESPGDLFDGTEIDEILTLRIMTLSDEEKRTAAGIDPRVGEMLARTGSLAREQLMSLHGKVRGMRPITQEQTND